MTYSKLLPKVIGKKFLKKKFEPQKIFDSLREETSITTENAKKVTDNVCIFLIASNLELITPPLIREIVNVELLKLGLEKERLQYTRIGFPVADLKKMIKHSEVMVFKTQYLMDKIFNGVIDEFNDVDELIKERENR